MKINFTRKFVPAAQTLQILRKAWLIKMRILSEAPGYVMYFCYYLAHNYGLAIILFTLISKIVLLPVSVWVQKNSIKMVKMQPEINRIKAKHFGDADRIADEQSKIFKREKYNPAGIPDPSRAVQIILLMGLVEVIYHPLDYLLHLPQDVITAFNGLAVSLAGANPESSSIQAGSSGDDQEWQLCRTVRSIAVRTGRGGHCVCITAGTGNFPELLRHEFKLGTFRSGRH